VHQTIAAAALTFALSGAVLPGPHLSSSPAKATTAVPSPSARQPLTILSVGDSLGEDLGWGMAAVLASDPHVRVVQDAVGSTGLANVAYYDWAAHLASDLARSKPQIVVVMLGGNDAVNFIQGGQYASFGSTLWRKLYGQRVHTLIAEARRAHARVVWVGMPVMATTSVLRNADMRDLNSVYQQQAESGGSALFVSTWKLFQGPRGGFAAYLRSPGGALEEVRDTDGVHIAPPAGDELVASAVVAAIDGTYGLGLCLAPYDPWRAEGAATCPA
jgi:uncharacterized protein